MLFHAALLRTVPIGFSMRNLLRSRRGAAAFATVIALVPLIGVVALGGEAGSWYVTKQHAQGAADAAAYSGALVLACQIGSSGGTCTGDTQTIAYRAGEFAAQNGFCDTSVYPSCTASSLLQRNLDDQPGPWTRRAEISFGRLYSRRSPRTCRPYCLATGPTSPSGPKLLLESRPWPSPHAPWH